LEGKAGEGFLRGVTAEPRPLFFGNPASSFHPRFALWCPLERVFVFHGLILAQGAKSRSRWAEATDALLRYRESPDAQRAALNGSWTERALVPPNTRGDPAYADNLHHRHWKPLLKQAGLLDIRFHDLRHTCSTLLLTKGVHPKVVSEMLGHADISITLDTYSHILPGN